jgi:hypothetical protein
VITAWFAVSLLGSDFWILTSDSCLPKQLGFGNLSVTIMVQC